MEKKAYERAQEVIFIYMDELSRSLQDKKKGQQETCRVSRIKRIMVSLVFYELVSAYD